MTIGIYLIKRRGLPYYVGSSINAERRLRVHFNDLRKFKHENRSLQGAWNKDGQDVFTSEILETCNVAELISKEQHWVEKFRSEGLELVNSKIFVENNVGMRWPNGKRSRQLKALWRKKSYREQMRSNGRAYWERLSEEKKTEYSAKMKARWQTPEWRAKMIAVNSMEARAKR